MDDELYVAFDGKVMTSSNNNSTIAPPIAWRGSQYLRGETVPMAAGQSAQCVLRVKSRHWAGPNASGRAAHLAAER
jgi:hypothetical protein